jgi:mitotic spindle assembly checkpoint protein MAD1
MIERTTFDEGPEEIIMDDVSFTTEERPGSNDSPDLNRTLENMDTKLLQKEIIILEKQILEQKMDFELKLLVSEEKWRKCREDSENLHQSLARLERDRRFLADRENDLLQDLKNSKTELERCKSDGIKSEQRMFQEIGMLKEELHNSQTALRLSESEFKHQLTLKDDTIRTQENLVTQFRSELEVKNAQIKDIRQEAESLKTKFSAVSTLSMERTVYDKDDISILEKCLSERNSQISEYERKIRILENENRRLEDRVARLGILEEEKVSLQSKLDMFEDTRGRLLSMESELIQLRREKASWRSFLKDGDYDSPGSLSRALAMQRQEYTLLADKNGELVAELRRAQMQTQEAYSKVPLKGEIYLYRRVSY